MRVEESEEEEASESAKEKTLMWSSWSSWGDVGRLGLGPRMTGQLREEVGLWRDAICDMGCGRAAEGQAGDGTNYISLVQHLRSIRLLRKISFSSSR